MPILIGGSPSTGSSLLRRILNRHSDIFCGPETSIFAKPVLYTNWNDKRHKILRPSVFGLPNAGFHHYIGIDLDDEYGISKNTCGEMIKKSENLSEFANLFYTPILERSEKTVWAEKTPANAFTLHHFLTEIPDSKVIHIVRHPLDVISSLFNRGKTVYEAIALYLLNTQSGLWSIEHPDHYMLKYEDLVSEPKDAVEDLCSFLEVGFEERMLSSDDVKSGVTKMDGWQYDESKCIEKGSVGRFQTLEIPIQKDILTRCVLTRSTHLSQCDSIIKIATKLGYSIPDLPINMEAGDLIREEIEKDIKHRRFKNCFFNGTNYPLDVY